MESIELRISHNLQRYDDVTTAEVNNISKKESRATDHHLNWRKVKRWRIREGVREWDGTQALSLLRTQVMEEGWRHLRRVEGREEVTRDGGIHRERHCHRHSLKQFPIFALEGYFGTTKEKLIRQWWCWQDWERWWIMELQEVWVTRSGRFVRRRVTSLWSKRWESEKERLPDRVEVALGRRANLMGSRLDQLYVIEETCRGESSR